MADTIPPAPTPEPASVRPAPAPPAKAAGGGRLLWLACGCLFGILISLGAQSLGKLVPEPPRVVAGFEPVDDALAKKEKAVQKQVADILASPTTPDEKAVHPVEEVASNARPDTSKFKIAEDHRTYDLRGWKPIDPKDGPHGCGVTMTRRMKLAKSAAVDRLDLLGRTSGSDLVMRDEEPAPDAARVYASKAKPVVEGKEMTEQRLSIDVAGVPVGTEFPVAARTTYWNSLQTPEEQWLGVTGSDGSRLLSILVLFPDDRPYQGGGLRTGPENGELQPYTDKMLVFKGDKGSWVYWEVPGPKPGHTYRFDWKW